MARASSTLLEPMRLLRLAEKVAVRMPIVMNGGHTLIGSRKIKLFWSRKREHEAAVRTDSTV